MLQYLPAGFGQKTAQTGLGAMAYYTPVGAPWTIEDSKPTIVFLHGFGGGSSAYEWSKVFTAFADTHRVIAPDLIGWGNSNHPVRRYRIEDYTITIAEFLQQVAPTPVTVVASTLTGGFAIRLATQKPELFESLFLVCPSGFSDFGQDAGRRLPSQFLEIPLLDRLIYTVGATNDLAVRNFLEQFLFANRDRITNEMVNAYLYSAQQPNAEYAALAFLRGDLYFDLSLYLPQLDVPTAILWGEKAQFTDVNLGQRLASINPRAVQKFQTIANVGVLANLEAPAIVSGLLASWLQSEKSIDSNIA